MLDGLQPDVLDEVGRTRARTCIPGQPQLDELSYWKALRSEVPWVRRPPSEYVADHVRVATQPIERPDDDAHLLQVMEMMDAGRLLLFSTDYPHWDFDSPTRAFPKLPHDLREAIFSTNARELYGLR